jgi:hypothetical protein
MRRSSLLWQTVLLAAAVGWLGLSPGAAAAENVIINEFMASNSRALADENGDYPDWIEIYNSGANTVNLGGWYLTDEATARTKWRFPATNLAPNSYLVVFASGKNRSATGLPLHTSFNLNAGGEYLALVKPDGVTMASEFEPEYPEQFEDVSYGIYQGEFRYFSSPTPGKPNSPGFLGYVADTKFSHDRGFFDAPFDLVINTETAGAGIRYTTNGTVPSITNGITYAGPILINGTTCIRAAAFKSGFQPSDVDTHTYIFLADVIRQSPTGQPPPGWPSSWGSNTRDYGMDPDVVNSARYSKTITNDLKAVPSFSIVMNLNDLFNASTGIYANAGQDGRAWERPCSVELINPDRAQGFQLNAGIRIRGGFSRSTANPKHAFRLFFREEYGAPKLRYPLFGDAGADTFDCIDLRTFQNYSWSFQGDNRGIFIRDQFSRDAQLEMGHEGERGYFYHLYINGQYWGLYNTCERPEASFGETYFGGSKTNYDVIKVETGPYSINATDGNMTAWTTLYNLAKANLATDAAYQRILGNNPDGTRNPAYARLIEEDNLIDYMLIIFYGGNLDAPISNFLSNTRPNNWYGIRDRTGTAGFRFFVHDAEHTLLNVNENRTGPYSAGDSSVVYSSPQWVWQKLLANAEFRMLVADHIHRHFFNNGLLTPASCSNLFMVRKNEIDRAVVGESARWGDAKRATPFTRDVEWMTEINRVLNNYIPQRSGIVLNQLRAKQLYPTVVAPSFNQHGGHVPRAFSLSMSAPTGTIYYTLDGTDPRLMGGAIAPNALRYQGPVRINESLQVKSRVWTGTNSWSALNEASFTVIQTFTELLITEIMYNPPAVGDLAEDDLEFVELKNVAPIELDLSGVHFTNGIRFVFPNGSKLGPGQFIVLASNPAGLTNRYPGAKVFGRYQGRLANGGETLTIVHAIGTPIVSLVYSDQAPWPKAADGTGFSLVPVSPNLNPDPSNPSNWRASSRVGGSPGADDPLVNITPVVINEVLTHTDPPQVDAIELHNPSQVPAWIGHWYLTDNRAVPAKYRFPTNTMIPAGGYLVITEADFNPAPGVDPSFTLSSHGEEVYLYSADAAGSLTGYSDGFSFGAAANDVTFGRYTTSAGEIQFPAQLDKTLGKPNSGPRIGPVVINEIHYHPLAGQPEFIELKNITASPVQLYDPAHPTNTWRLNGVGFEFAPGAEISAKGLLLVVNGDPATFRMRHNVPGNVPVVGPYPGVLQDNGELLQLQRPDTPDVDTNGVVFVPYVVVDEVRYDNQPPWPTDAAGAGSSLERLQAQAYGNDPLNWRASDGALSPGLENSGNRLPRVNAGADVSIQAAMFPWATNLTGAATDDGLPRPPGRLSIAWRQIAGPGPVIIDNPNQLISAASFPGVGTYALRLTADDGELEARDDLLITIERPSAQVAFVSAGSRWKYLDNGSNQGSSWRLPGFADNTWAEGKAQLGYGDGDEATPVGYGPNSASKFVTTYFRHTFQVQNAASVKQLTVRLLRDDGAVVYLNGVEIFRSNMPEGDITYSTPASAVVSGEDETTTFFEHEVDPALFNDGQNVLAVEVHQQNVGSTDLSFDLELSGLALPGNKTPVVNAGTDIWIKLPAAAELFGSVVDDGLPIPPGLLTNWWTQLAGPGTISFDSLQSVRTIARFTVPGTYTLRLTGSDGQFSISDDLIVTVSEEDLADWKGRHFTAGELADPSVSGDDADPDYDTLTNLQEFLSGTNPRDTQSFLKINSLNLNGAGIILQFHTVAGKSYTVQYCEALAEGVWRKLADVAAGSVQRLVEVSDSVPNGHPSRYYRLITPAMP